MVQGCSSDSSKSALVIKLGFAEMADCQVILVADIEWGEVFAHPVGTLALLSTSEQMRVERYPESKKLLSSGR